MDTVIQTADYTSMPLNTSWTKMQKKPYHGLKTTTMPGHSQWITVKLFKTGINISSTTRGIENYEIGNEKG